MRALSIVVFILMISIASSTVNAVLGAGSAPSPATPVNLSRSDVEEIVSNNTGWWSGITDGIKLAFKSLSLLWKIVKGTLFLGSTVSDMSPWPLPAPLEAGLDTVSLVAVAVAVIQVVRGLLLE